MVQQPIQQGRRQGAVAAEGLVPLPEIEIAGDDQAAVLVALGDDLEEIVGGALLQRQIPQLVDDQ